MKFNLRKYNNHREAKRRTKAEKRFQDRKTLAMAKAILL